jgi:hypothetical protein
MITGMKYKRIYFDKTKSNKYFVAKLFKTKKQMQDAYKKASPKDDGHYKVLGVHQAYKKYSTNGTKGISPETGTVFLSLENCGAGIVCHEIMHAVLWGRGHKKYKKQYPIIIKNMVEEEKMLHAFTRCIIQFYDWYWKVKKVI